MQILSVLFAALLVPIAAVSAENTVSADYQDHNGYSNKLQIRVMTPAGLTQGGKAPAVVILHHAGGWSAQTTQQYAEVLSAAGFITIEPNMFVDKPLPSHTVVPMVFGALKYAASRTDVDPSKIGVMGLSMGAQMSIYAISDWAVQKYGGGVKFASALALYPACWIFRDVYKNALGRFKNTNYPDDFLNKFTGVSLTVLAAGKDDYDSKKPDVCNQWLSLMPDARQKALTSIEVYQTATHGWDHGRTYSFRTPFANEGRGGTNTNTYDPAITALSKERAVKFFKDTLGQ